MGKMLPFVGAGAIGSYLGRPTEIDSMNGYVVARGVERGVPTPVSAAVDIVRDVEAGGGSRRRRTSGRCFAEPAGKTRSGADER